jgi:hypothetical protein
MTEFVCAWCDVYCRIPCEERDENGVVFQTSTRCAYCERTELRLGKRGYQTPIPPAREPPEGFPF